MLKLSDIERGQEQDQENPVSYAFKYLNPPASQVITEEILEEGEDREE
jgi:hypothetical protein